MRSAKIYQTSRDPITIIFEQKKLDFFWKQDQKCKIKK